MERREQIGQRPWDPRNNTLAGSLAFLFASDRQMKMKKLPTQKFQLAQTKEVSTKACCFQSKNQETDFPGGPVVKTLCSQGRGPGSDP